MNGMMYLSVALFAYLIGSAPFALVVSKAMKLADPRSYGSGNPGATNVLRSRSLRSVRHSSSARRGQRGDLVHHRIFLSLFIARGACHSGICAPLPNVDLW